MSHTPGHGILCITRHEEKGKNQDTIIIEVPPGAETQKIEVILIRNKGAQSRIGIKCCRSIGVVRKEVYSEEGIINKRAQLKRRSAEAEGKLNSLVMEDNHGNS